MQAWTESGRAGGRERGARSIGEDRYAVIRDPAGAVLGLIG
jgi:hypothetical protein